MSLSNLISQRITGVNPFNELPIDEAVWREAHGYHSSHSQLHLMAHHRPGVVFGLEVVASKAGVTVAPGVAVTDTGKTVVLDAPVSLNLSQAGQTYITIAFEETLDAASGISVGGGVKYSRLVEGRIVAASTTRPASPQIELARIDRSSAKAAPKDARNPFDPERDEINLLHRPIAFPHCYADGAMGELGVVPVDNPEAWKPNRAGLWNLIREGNGRGFHLDFVGPYRLLQKHGDESPILLYAAGEEAFQPLSKEISGLGEYLNTGGFLFCESVGGNADFKECFLEIVKKLNSKMKPVPAGHPIFSSHHVFAGPPAGAEQKGELLIDESGSILFSSFNYGGAWQGVLDKVDGVESRERIRAAQEFGLNILAFAAYRRRRFQLDAMTGGSGKGAAPVQDEDGKD
jgi:hypothetical protein